MVFSAAAAQRGMAAPRCLQRQAHSQHGSAQSHFVNRSLRSGFSAGSPLAPLRQAAPRAAGRAAGVRVEANLFGRIVRVFKSYANSVVSAAEDPEKILDQAVEDMQRDLIRLRQGAAEVTASQKRMQNKASLAQTTADEWYRRAELALGKGDEELAREALSRRKSFQDNANLLKGQLDQQTKAVETIIGNMRMLDSKLAEAKMKKDTLKARAQSAKSARAITDMVAGMDTSSALGAFEKMEEKVMAMESEAEAATMLVAPDNLESKFRALEGDAVDDELSRMKAALGSGSSRSGPPRELPEGRPFKDAIDVELDQMRQQRKSN